MPLFPTAFWKTAGGTPSGDGYLPPENTTGDDVVNISHQVSVEVPFRNPNTGTMTVTHGALVHINGDHTGVITFGPASITIPGGGIGVFTAGATNKTETSTTEITWSVAAAGSGTYGTLTIFSGD